jgi:hypothetical protein
VIIASMKKIVATGSQSLAKDRTSSEKLPITSTW